jgi:hypothetical protein
MAKTNWSAACLAALILGCSGDITDSSGTPAPGVGSDGSPIPSGTLPAVNDPNAPSLMDLPTPGPQAGLDGAGPYPLSRLTRTEYVNTIRDLTDGRVLIDQERLPADALGSSGFTTDVPVSQVELDQLYRAAELAAPEVYANLNQRSPCDEAVTGEAECAAQYVSYAGLRIFRRPVQASEVETLAAHYEHLKTTVGLAHGEALRVVTLTMLLSPNFLYRSEIGHDAPEVEGRLVRFNDFELASRLSYFLWRSMPDEVLFTAAGAGQLESAEQVAAQARRMLDDERARDSVFSFVSQWMGIDDISTEQKDNGLFPEFTGQLANDLGEETRRFVDYVVFEGDGTLNTLLNANFSFANARVAAFYGIEGVSGEEFVRVELPSERAGLFTHGSFLASSSLPSGTSPPRRAKTIMEHVACLPVPPPPAGLMVTPPLPTEGKQTREVFEEHAIDPQCAGCHQVMDPIGFAFEGFDASGATREEELGRPIDSSGSVAGVGDFQNASELMNLLAGRPETGTCSTKYWLRFMLNRVETPEEEPSMTAVVNQFAASGYNIPELLIAITTSPTFRFRTRAEGEL